MKIINYFSAAVIPIIIAIIIISALVEKKSTYDIFIEGAKEGIEIVISLFPTLLGIFIAVGVLRSSGVLDFLVQIISPITNVLKIPSEIMPLALIRPISGSASTAIATDIMKNYGVDSNIGLIASTIMGSTETTFYTIAIYTSAVGIKKIKYVLPIALLGDVTRNACVCCILAIYVVKFFLTFKKNSDIMFTEKLIRMLKMLIQILLFLFIYFFIRNILIILCSKILQNKIKK